MVAGVLGWGLPCQITPYLLHKRPKGRFGLHAIVPKYLLDLQFNQNHLTILWCTYLLSRFRVMQGHMTNEISFMSESSLALRAFVRFFLKNGKK